MQRAAIVTGTLGLGTALVFAAAALAATLFPSGSTIPASQTGAWDRPMPMPAIEPRVIDEGKGGVIQGDDVIVREVVPAQP